MHGKHRGWATLKVTMGRTCPRFLISPCHLCKKTQDVDQYTVKVRGNLIVMPHKTTESISEYDQNVFQLS